MIRNMGTTDRITRAVIGIAAVVVSLVFGWGSTVGAIVGIGLLVVAAVMLVTAALGYCPLYRLPNISTNPTLHKVAKS